MTAEWVPKHVMAARQRGPNPRLNIRRRFFSTEWDGHDYKAEKELLALAYRVARHHGTLLACGWEGDQYVLTLFIPGAGR